MENEFDLDFFETTDDASFDLSEVFDRETLRDIELSEFRESEGIY